MYQRLHALKARILVVSLMFLASACVIQRTNDQTKTGEEPVQPMTPATKAEAEKAETAVAKAPAAKAQTTKTVAAKPAAATAPAVKAAATPAPTLAGAAAAPAGKPADKKVVAASASTVKHSRVSRYVGAGNLNVRSRADAHAPIVGRLARGSMVTVSVDGTWAKIGDSQFVAVKHLTKSQPSGKRLISRK